MQKIDNSILSNLSLNAKLSARKRMNLNIHKTNEDPIQRFFNALEPGTYIRPHKHEKPDKRELFVLIKGKFAIVEFDNAGNINDTFILNQNTGDIAVEIEPGVYHTVIALESNSIALEIKDGPYDIKNDKNFAAWAPDENDTSAVEVYINNLLHQISDNNKTKK